MRGIVIKSPWIELILEGRKTWEIRSKPTSVRERIALIISKSGQILGTADLVACHGPMTREQMMEKYEQHQIPPERMTEVDYAHFFAWELRDVKPLPQPVRYQHPSGAVIWVSLTDENVSGGLKAIAPVT